MIKIDKLKSGYKNNIKVVENYFFMTALQLISSAFGILIYPYLIRVLGSESYGIYVFAIAIVSYFSSFISFGFNLPGLKLVSQNKDSVVVKSEIISSILTLKIILGIIGTLIFIPILFFVPFIFDNKFLFFVAYLQIIAEIIYPVWYFQGVQKMKIVTYYQLFFRIASLPFIFIFIKSANDVNLYMIISSLSIILPAISLYIYLLKTEKLKIQLRKFTVLKSYVLDALPFFWSNIAGTIKQESVTILIGSFLGMRDVALYDLANKLILLPRMLTTSINSAIFPRVIEDLKTKTIKKIIRYEWMIGLAAVGFVAIFGYWIILILAGKTMIDAYPLAIILSFTIVVWLVVGSYINFIFVPQNKYYFVTNNQIIALLSFAVLAIPALFFMQNSYALVGSLTLSGVCEIIYCKYLIRKYNLL
jgi:polysaccharide transporter, PST family